MKNCLSHMWVAILLLFALASSARPFDKVLGAIISVVPEEENVFKQELMDILSSFINLESSNSNSYLPPEHFINLENVYWDKVTVLIKQKFGPPEKLHGWQLEIYEIYLDKRDYNNYRLKESKHKDNKQKCECCCMLF